MTTLRSAVAKVSETWKMKIAQRSFFEKTIKDFNFNTGYYNQIGLRWHDIMPRNAVVEEAFRRLPREEREDMDFRLARATLLSANKTILSKEEWTKQEEDVPYLDPYIKLIERELRNKADWDNFISPRTYP
uniref:Cytochrome b-c1 complex subunit 7 n=1 Tax=Echinococcus multilocularis TaxID=6211 RepID=QCR7_ECHMU|nr:RecName: Full=Cytochrome b-c1 complex subunit 7; AltName: Full=Complex III subunit 7; AltName: Full=Complex III subunit VII; AltName: Full=Ubiquinol-cytochrome c reductase complex 14 kDa protein [Echinococcus multilocularis]CAC18542.1 putative ubiquinol cytochrome C reductase complex 14 kD protein [Echinococcus multilocularis]